MNEVRVEVGTVWRDQWNNVRVKIVAMADGTVTVEDLASGKQRTYGEVRAFLDVYVSD